MQRKEKRLLNAFLIIVSAVLIVGLLTLFNALPDKEITHYEIRVFGLSLLLILVVLIVVIFMIRNAIMANSTFLIRMRDALTNNSKTLKDLESEYRNLHRAIINNTKETTGLHNELRRLNDTQGND